MSANELNIVTALIAVAGSAVAVAVAVAVANRISRIFGR